MPSSVLTSLLYLDALLNFGSSLRFFIFPPPPQLEPETLFLVQTLAVYFALGGGTMLVAARTEDTAVRRGLMSAYAIGGILHMAAALQPSIWALQSGKYAVAGDIAITATYLYFLVRGE